MKERFTIEEWELLKRLPFATFVFIAIADGEIDSREFANFETRLNNAGKYREPLQRELLLDLLGSDVEALLEEAMDSVVEDLEDAKRILAARLTREEYHRFLASLFTLGLAADESVRTGKAMGALVDWLEVDVDAGLQSLARV